MNGCLSSLASSITFLLVVVCTEYILHLNDLVKLAFTNCKLTITRFDGERGICTPLSNPMLNCKINKHSIM